jgi:hypothetical protein
MSLNTFPTFIGIGWDINKRLISSTDVDAASGGQEFRTSRFGTSLLAEFDVVINYMGQTDRNTLETFFINQQGPNIPFNFSFTNDPGNPFVVRFLDDSLEINQMANQMYESSFTLRSVR